MSNDNAHQSGLTAAERTTIQAAKRLADSMGNTWLSSDLETILATHSADARNGEGVALTDEIAERVSKMRNALYAIAQSDPNGYAYELRVIATKAWEESLTLAAPAAPAPTTRDEIEARQRAAMKTRFAGRPTSPATADFDLPAPNDAAPAPAAKGVTDEIAMRVALAIIANLEDRRGVLDDVDDEIKQEIAEEIALTIKAKTFPSAKGKS